jgi:hypothetical protein
VKIRRVRTKSQVRWRGLRMNWPVHFPSSQWGPGGFCVRQAPEPHECSVSFSIDPAPSEAAMRLQKTLGIRHVPKVSAPLQGFVDGGAACPRALFAPWAGAESPLWGWACARASQCGSCGHALRRLGFAGYPAAPKRSIQLQTAIAEVAVALERGLAQWSGEYASNRMTKGLSPTGANQECL